MKKNLTTILPVFIFFLSLPLFFNSVQAAYFKFDQTTVSVASGGTFQIAVMVEPGSDSLNAAEAYVTYDSGVLNATSVAAGSLFPTVSHDVSTAGKVYIAGMVNDPASSISVSGTLATITFQASNTGTGSVTISYDCNTSKIIKDDINASNVIVCSQNGTATVVVGNCAPDSSGAIPTICAPTSQPASSQQSGSTPSELPQSGVFENVVKFAIPGLLLFLVGGVFRLLL